MSKGLLSSIEDTFQPYVHSGTIKPIISPQPQACYPLLERYHFSRVLDDQVEIENPAVGFFSIVLVLKKGGFVTLFATHL